MPNPYAAGPTAGQPWTQFGIPGMNFGQVGSFPGLGGAGAPGPPGAPGIGASPDAFGSLLPFGAPGQFPTGPGGGGFDQWNFMPPWMRMQQAFTDIPSYSQRTPDLRSELSAGLETGTGSQGFTNPFAEREREERERERNSGSGVPVINGRVIPGDGNKWGQIQGTPAGNVAGPSQTRPPSYPGFQTRPPSYPGFAPNQSQVLKPSAAADPLNPRGTPPPLQTRPPGGGFTPPPGGGGGPGMFSAPVGQPPMFSRPIGEPPVQVRPPAGGGPSADFAPAPMQTRPPDAPYIQRGPPQLTRPPGAPTGPPPLQTRPPGAPTGAIPGQTRPPGSPTAQRAVPVPMQVRPPGLQAPDPGPMGTPELGGGDLPPQLRALVAQGLVPPHIAQAALSQMGGFRR